MARRSLLDGIKITRALKAKIVNDDTEGTGVEIDTQGFDGCAFALDLGISGDTLSGSVKFLAEVQESDTAGSGHTTVAAADLVNSTLALVDDPAEDDVLQVVEYVGSKRYVRLFIDTTGTHTVGTPMSAICIQGYAAKAPVTQGT